MKDAKYQLGLVSISFRQHSPEDILKATAHAGLICVEWGSDVHAPCRDMEKLQQIAALQKEYGITCSSYGTYFRLGQTPLTELNDYIAAAKTLGTDILRLWCGDKSGESYSEAQRLELLEQCRQAAALAEQAGVTLCLECHTATFTERLSDALWLMEQLDSPSLRMYWQPSQWRSVEQNLAYAEAIAPYTRHVHVFQWKGDARLSLNDGIDEWRGYLGKLSAPRTLLLEFMPDDRLTTLPVEGKALKTMIGGLT